MTMINLKAYKKDNDGLTSELVLSINLRGIKDLGVNRQAKASTRRSEVGYEYTDNMSIQSNKVTLNGYVSDTNKDDDDEWTSEKSYIDGIENSLISIYENKYFCNIYDNKRGKVYEDYILLDLKISEKDKSTYGFEYSMDFQEVRFSTVGITEYVVTVEKGGPTAKSKGGSGSSGEEVVSSGKESLLQSGTSAIFSSISSLLGGN